MASKWGSGDITWSFAHDASYSGIKFLSGMDAYPQDQIRQAFDIWEKLLDISFVEVPETVSAAIRLGWSTISGGYGGLTSWQMDHGASITSAQIQFDPTQYWADSFSALAEHEIGHAIGLGHKDDATSIMNPNVMVYNPSYGDIDTAAKLYGARKVTADDANNFFIATTGDDTIDGKGGVDTVYFGAHSRTVTIERSDVHVTVTGNGADHFANVERLAFQEAVLAFDTDGNAGRAYRVYQAAFDRTPDESGLGFWVRQMDAGATLANVAAGFVSSQEFLDVYGRSVSDADFIDKLYQNVLGRDGEAGGVSFWEGQLASGVSKELVLAGFSESPENIAGVAPAISGGIWYY